MRALSGFVLAGLEVVSGVKGEPDLGPPPEPQRTSAEAQGVQNSEKLDDIWAALAKGLSRPERKPEIELPAERSRDTSRRERREEVLDRLDSASGKHERSRDRLAAESEAVSGRLTRAMKESSERVRAGAERLMRDTDRLLKEGREELDRSVERRKKALSEAFDKIKMPPPEPQASTDASNGTEENELNKAEGSAPPAPSTKPDVQGGEVPEGIVPKKFQPTGPEIAGAENGNSYSPSAFLIPGVKGAVIKDSGEGPTRASEGARRNFYINGANTTYDEAISAAQKMGGILGEDLILLHNPSKGLMRDTLETAGELLDLGPDKDEEMLPFALAEEWDRALKDPKMKDVRVFSHSQGALKIREGLKQLRTQYYPNDSDQEFSDRIAKKFRFHLFGAAGASLPVGEALSFEDQSDSVASPLQRLDRFLNRGGSQPLAIEHDGGFYTDYTMYIPHSDEIVNVRNIHGRESHRIVNYLNRWDDYVARQIEVESGSDPKKSLDRFVAIAENGEYNDLVLSRTLERVLFNISEREGRGEVVRGTANVLRDQLRERFPNNQIGDYRIPRALLMYQGY